MEVQFIERVPDYKEQMVFLWVYSPLKWSVMTFAEHTLYYRMLKAFFQFSNGNYINVESVHSRYKVFFLVFSFEQYSFTFK